MQNTVTVPGGAPIENVLWKGRRCECEKLK